MEGVGGCRGKEGKVLSPDLIKVGDDFIEDSQALDALVVGVQLHVELGEVGDGGEENGRPAVLLTVQLLLSNTNTATHLLQMLSNTITTTTRLQQHLSNTITTTTHLQQQLSNTTRLQQQLSNNHQQHTSSNSFASKKIIFH